jgi:phospholipid/cholesterol/gamma-HCH transport system substrate-binding protein
MENRSHALAAGLFTIAFIGALIIAALWFGGDVARLDTYLLVSKTPVSGLSPGSAVRYRGVDVGKVETIRFDPEDTRNILIKISVNAETLVTRGTFAQLGYQGITGNAYIQLDDDGAPSERLQTSARDPARIAVRPSLLDQIMGSSQQLLGSVSEVGKRLNLMLSDKNREQLVQTLTSIDSAAIQMAKLGKGLEPAVNRLPAVAQNAEGMLKNLNTLTVLLQQRVYTLEKIAGSAEKLGNTSQDLGQNVMSSTLPKLYDLMEDLSRSSRNLEKLLAELNEQPQSIVFGKPQPAPGPGEPGFVEPQGGN